MVLFRMFHMTRGLLVGSDDSPEPTLFPRTDPAIDGEDCNRDCESCTIKYPSRWRIDEGSPIYGHVKGWSRHLLVATGKSDWKGHVEDENGSLMEAIIKGGHKPNHGRLMLSASNLPVPDHGLQDHPSGDQPTSVLLLPAFTFIDNVTPSRVPSLVSNYINPSLTTTTPIGDVSTSELPQRSPDGLIARPCHHRAIILLCSHKTRDSRCGQSAPLLQKEFTRHLRALGLDRDNDDKRPGGVGIHFVSHTGGHKFAANVIIYRRRMAEDEAVGGVLGDEEEGAVQGIWLARVRPEDCEGIIKYTLLKGKVVKPERQLRGGFDRATGLASW